MNKIYGYRTLSDDDIENINLVKSVAEEIGNMVAKFEQANDVDQRWVAIAKTDLQKGFMSLIRSIAQPTTF